MRKFIILIFFSTLTVSCSKGQKKYEYAIIHLHWEAHKVLYSDRESEWVSETAKCKKDCDRALKKVTQLEDEGWEMLSIENQEGVPAFVMRKERK